MQNLTSPSGFTLINVRYLFRKRAVTMLELLVVLAIIAILAGLLFPVMSKMRNSAEKTACLSNLRQIGAAALLYAAEHDQTLPVIEPSPAHPMLEPEDGARPLKEVLAPYGINDEVAKCPSDAKGPKFFASEGTSYFWYYFLNGRKLTSLSDEETISPSSMPLAADYGSNSPKHQNFVFADGHVVGGDAAKPQ
jgi:prepilin-type N-terminal cleavage/methylation domain-containing protein